MSSPHANITEAAPDDPALLALIAHHAAYCASVTPEGSGHAVEAVERPPQHLRYWTAVIDDEVVGCIGLATSAGSGGDAEIKTMHVREAVRGRGLAERLLNAAARSAREAGAQRLVLETGRGAGFAASRRFYARSGFAPIDAFGPYASDPFSVCMAKALP